MRICQEPLANVRKHARASKVDINLTFEESTVKLNIRDNGIGFDTKATTKGAFGLIGMCERAGLLGGALMVRSEKSKGTLVEVEILPQIEVSVTCYRVIKAICRNKEVEAIRILIAE